jgi:hypothetical protein
MTLLHHSSFDSNYEVVKEMASLPYFKDIVNDNGNEVTLIFSKDI